jgi:2-keto-4-pentenoate hydratase/2-oxohepta-3-ene-1,7-dioic acid hydratase in catechol pathway
MGRCSSTMPRWSKYGPLPHPASCRHPTDGLADRPPVGRIGKIVCTGLNYHDHAAETGAPVPREPILFLKAPDTVVGPRTPFLCRAAA